MPKMKFGFRENVPIILYMLGNQSDVFNLLEKEQKESKTKFYTINAMLIKLGFIRIVNVLLLVTFCLHLFTCDNMVQYL